MWHAPNTIRTASSPAILHFPEVYEHCLYSSCPRQHRHVWIRHRRRSEYRLSRSGLFLQSEARSAARGWPASSHQFRELIPALASRFHVIAPDYPGFGNSDTPDPVVFPYTFDKLAEITQGFLKAKGFERYGLYFQDYGGPVGFRIMTKNPDALDWLIIQNTNAYEVGFSAAWAGLRNALGLTAVKRTSKEQRACSNWIRLRLPTWAAQPIPLLLP